MKKNIVLIGAGSAQFGYGTMGDIFQSKVLEGSHVTLLDINPDTLAVVEKTGQDFIKEHDLNFTLSATTNRREALVGADFIVSSIEVGPRFPLWEEDWRIPQQYGVTQVYGENGGPGGLFHSLRITPIILEICDDIMEICPEAVVFNFSNPMSRICTTVTRKYPEMKFIVMCHEIASLRTYIPYILKRPYEELQVRAAGLNHFSCVLEAREKATGKDIYPELMEKAYPFFERIPKMSEVMKLYKELGTVPSMEQMATLETESWPERKLFKAIMDQFGLFPITTDSHFGEYIQWAHDVVDHHGIMEFYNNYKKYLGSDFKGEIRLQLSERIIPIIEGILTDSGYEEPAVNIPNNGAIKELPDWIVVEVPAIVDKDGVHAVELPELPKGYAGLLLNQVAVHDLTAEAILTGSRQAVVQACLVDPIVNGYQKIEEMVDTMIEIQEKHLGYLK